MFIALMVLVAIAVVFASAFDEKLNAAVRTEVVDFPDLWAQETEQDED